MVGFSEFGYAAGQHMWTTHVDQEVETTTRSICFYLYSLRLIDSPIRHLAPLLISLTPDLRCPKTISILYSAIWLLSFVVYTKLLMSARSMQMSMFQKPLCSKPNSGPLVRTEFCEPSIQTNSYSVDNPWGSILSRSLGHGLFRPSSRYA